ncbi:MAG: histidine--tRNA ligase [Pyrinomonadaceae bacterium]
MASTNPARGMRDFLPSDVRKRNYVIGIIKSVYESYGFEPLETPAVENIETLMGKYGEEGNQLIFKILKRGEKLKESRESRVESPENETPAPDSLSDLALRYDLTVPLARVVAHHKNDLPKFFKRYQIQPVWRADRPARGRFREFYQCDVDAIGSGSMLVEAELISAVSEILTRLGFEAFSIYLNNRKLLTGILQSAGVAQNQHVDVLTAFDKMDKIGPEGVGRELAERNVGSGILKFLDLTTSLATKGVDLFTHDFDAKTSLLKYNEISLQSLSGFITNDENGRQGIEELEQILDLTKNTPAGEHIEINPRLARGLAYYTGTIMEIALLPEDNDSVFENFSVSLGGGGRYDGLIGMFGKEQIPACGFSLGLERILVVMAERNMFPPEIAASNSADLMVTIWNEDSIGESLKLANELRGEDLRVTVYPEVDKLGKQLKYADTISVPFACILGDEEREQGKVLLKDMKSGEKFVLTVAEIVERIKAV